MPLTELSDVAESDLPLIYLYEGDRDLDNFIKSSLYKKYNVKIVNDSFGIKQLRQQMPALIIIDLPYGDDAGLDIYKQVKNDAVLSSIPVIIISSVSTDEDKQKAYEMGADAYITKPFDLLYLSTRIKQTFDLRKTIKETVKKELIVNPKEVDITSDDNIFLANVMNVIEENISNTEFNIDDLCEKLNVSRSMLYRKIIQQTNQPPIEFIKKVRLKRAANLLEVTSYNIAEISSMIGFSDQRYFSSCFKKEYGVTPKKYSFRKKGKKPSE